MNKLKLWLHLLSTPELGRKTIRKLIKLHGDPENFIGFKNKLCDLDFLNSSQISYLTNYQESQQWSDVFDLISNCNIKFVTILDNDYPTYLSSIFDPPVMLFYRGDLNCINNKPCLAVVGTRRPSNYGKIVTKKITEKLTAAGFTIVSGLAYGIDAAAHKACLNRGGQTAAVMATGPDQVYPPGNQRLAEKIIEQGVILSEYLPGSKAEVWCFPTRNRIISGLCKGSVIIEGSRKSGALLTAKFALDQNRDIFALPGDITRPQSAGPNYLIRSGAKPVTEINDILEEYDVLFQEENEQKPAMSSEEKQIFQIILKNRPEISFDKILLESGKNINKLSSLLLAMELKSLIKRIESNKYMVV